MKYENIICVWLNVEFHAGKKDSERARKKKVETTESVLTPWTMEGAEI